jgi:hypothetical protein
VKREDIERKVKREEKLGMPKGNGHKMFGNTLVPICSHDLMCESLNLDIRIF